MKLFNNSGNTYNTGNGLSIVGAVTQSFINSKDISDTATSLQQYFIGSPSSIAITIGTAIFFAGGYSYDKSFKNPDEPDFGQLKKGHILSALGAGFVALGLSGIAANDLALGAAILGGLMHVGGKLGSVFDEARGNLYKYLPLASRGPALLSLGLDITASNMDSLPLIGTMIIANLIWARADTMLMDDGIAKRALSRALLIPKGPK